MSEPRRRKGRPPSRDQERQALLELGANASGSEWAQRWRDELGQQGRRVAGGWPGTISEARELARAHCAAELRRAGLPALTFEELEQIARVAYARARRDWLARAERGEPASEG